MFGLENYLQYQIVRDIARAALRCLLQKIDEFEQTPKVTPFSEPINTASNESTN